jgi:hypothetical protein
VSVSGGHNERRMKLLCNEFNFLYDDATFLYDDVPFLCDYLVFLCDYYACRTPMYFQEENGCLKQL